MEWKDWIEEEKSEALELLRLAGVSEEVRGKLHSNRTLQLALEVAYGVLGECLWQGQEADNWLKRFYALTGEHWVLTEEGWMPASENTQAVLNDEPDAVLDEVNAAQCCVSLTNNRELEVVGATPEVSTYLKPKDTIEVDI